MNLSDTSVDSILDRTWDKVFGEGSFNRTFGDGASAWSDRTFGNQTEQTVGDAYKHSTGGLSDAQLSTDESGNIGAVTTTSKRNTYKERAEAASGDGFVADVALAGSGLGPGVQGS